MEIVYRIVEGKLKNVKNGKEVDIKFGIAELVNGFYYFDIYILNESFRDQYYENEKMIMVPHEIVGKTDKNEDISINQLYITKLSPKKNSKIRYLCEGFMEITTPSDYDDVGFVEKETTIRYIELEGLDLFLADHTFKNHVRQGKAIKKYNNFEFDHYSAMMICNNISQISNNFEVEFFKSAVNENYLLKFKYNENNNLTLKSYYEIKEDFISLLSFVNNGLVRVRRELYGKFAAMEQDEFITSSKNKIYSFRNLKKPISNDYLSINDRRNRSDGTLKTILLKSLDSFIVENKKLNLSSAINNLIKAESVSMEERYYILITVLEKLASNLHQSMPQTQTGMVEVISSTIFDELKTDLLNVMEQYKNRIPIPETYNIFLSKIGNLNKINKNGTMEKLKSLFEYAEVELTENLESLLINERNTAVHEGKFGKSMDEMYKNYYVLDHAIRDVILNLIKYQGVRIKRI